MGSDVTGLEHIQSRAESRGFVSAFLLCFSAVRSTLTCKAYAVSGGGRSKRLLNELDISVVTGVRCSPTDACEEHRLPSIWKGSCHALKKADLSGAAGDRLQGTNIHLIVTDGLWSLRTGVYMLYFICHTELVRLTEHFRGTGKSEQQKGRSQWCSHRAIGNH